MNHRGERRHGQHITRQFNRALFRLPLYFLHAPRMRHRADMPNVIQNFARSRLEKVCQLSIMFPGARHGLFIDRAFRRAECATFAGNIRLRKIEPHVPLALLFRVVKWMRVQEGPHKLPAHILKPKFKMRVLIDGVMPAEIRAGANGHALLFRDFVGADQPRRIARARRSHGGIKGVVKRVAQRYARSRRLDRRSR